MAHFAKSMIRQAFQAWDVDGNGTIEKEELAQVLNQLGNFKPGDIDKIMLEADQNCDGLIHYDEFVDWLMRPVVTIGAAVLLSTNSLCLRAEKAFLGNPTKAGAGGPARWAFGAEDIIPVRFSRDLMLQCEHTLVVWAHVEALEADWVPLISDSRPNWGFSFGISKDSKFGLFDPRAGKEAKPELANEKVGVVPGKWSMFVARGLCSTPQPTAKGKTEFLVASDDECMRMLGTINCVGSGVVISEFGSSTKGISGIGSVALWPRLLADEELKQLFLWDAVQYECLTEAQAAWHKLNRRRAPKRDEEEEAELQRRLEAAATGKIGGCLDLQEMKLVDDDLPRVVQAVEAAFDSVNALALCDNYITEDGVRDHLAPFMQCLSDHFRLDLHKNLDINRDAEGPLLDIMAKLPTQFGVIIDTRGTGFNGGAIAKLLNQGQQASDAPMSVAKERARTAQREAAFDAAQQTLAAKWADQTDPAMPWANDGPLPVVDIAELAEQESGNPILVVTNAINAMIQKNGTKDFTRGRSLEEIGKVLFPKYTNQKLILRKGTERMEIASCDLKVFDLAQLFSDDSRVENDIRRLIDEGPFDKFPEGKKNELEDLRAYLATAAKAMYDHKAGTQMAWATSGGRGLPENCGTGQLIAHFSYFSYSVRPRTHEDFGFRLREKGEKVDASMVKKGAVGLHAAVESGAVKLEASSGKSYGHNAVTLRLLSASSEPLCVAVPAGTIFQHIRWVHHQSLLVGRTVHIDLQPGQSKEQKLGAFCMNETCCCADDDPMALTALQLKDTSLLRSQGQVWDYFEGLFAKYREEAGFAAGGKKKAGKNKK